MSEAERSARAVLSAVVEPGHLATARAVRRGGAVAVLERLRRGDAQLDPHGRHQVRVRSILGAQLLEQAADKGIDFLVPSDEHWPSALDDLQWVERDGRGEVPLGLWLRGAQSAAPLGDAPVSRPPVAVVGARAATAYGTGVAGDLAATLGDAGHEVVSGAAYGIDAAVHRGVLAVGGRTVAVLAGGVDVPYPRGHQTLLRAVTEQGLVVSEAAPGTAVTRHRFLVRNRIVAALGVVVVVVEAGHRSGALSTVAWACALGRVVAAVPGPVTSSMSAGPHRLIRDHEAVLVADGDAVRELAAPIGQMTLPIGGIAASQVGRATPWDGLDDVPRTVGEALPARRHVSVAELASSTGLSVGLVLVGLAELARRGICEGGGDRWRLTASGRQGSQGAPAAGGA